MDSKNQPKYMHTQQIASAVESMEQFVVQSFIKKRVKAFLDAIHSASYTLKIFERLVKEIETDVIEKRTISELLNEWRYDEELKERILHWQTLEGCEAKYAPLPENLHPSLVKALRTRGIEQLYTHQRQAFEYAMEGVSFTAVTPTASGKSYCYHLPVLQKY